MYRKTDPSPKRKSLYERLFGTAAERAATRARYPRAKWIFILTYWIIIPSIVTIARQVTRYDDFPHQLLISAWFGLTGGAIIMAATLIFRLNKPD